MMFDIFRKKQENQPQPEKSKNGFFHGDGFENFHHSDIYEAAYKSSVRIHPNDLVPVDNDGAAMDSNEYQSAKLMSSWLSSLPEEQYAWFGNQSFIGWQTCAILAQNWLIDKCMTMPAKDCVRHGYDITINSGDDIAPEIFDEMRRLDKVYKIKKNCIEFVRNARIFGIRHALFLVDSPDPKYYERPFNPDGIMPNTYRGITQIDPYWIAPELDRSAAADPSAKDFYNPTWWRVNGRRVHRSHFVISNNGGEVPDILKPTYFYGGIPTTQKIFNRVYAAERTANEAPMLAMTKRLTALKTDTAKAISNPAAFSQKMSVWTRLMNNFGTRIVGEDEELTQFDTSLSGLDETIMTQYQIVAAAANVPATKLLGTTPKGFNSSGEYEENSYHEELESIQENDLTELVDKHHICIMRSFIVPQFGIKPVTTEVVWKPVNAMGSKELAEVNKVKADTDAILSTAGAIDGFDIRQRLINDPDSGYNGIPDVVPNGVGDREHDQEMEQALLDNDEETEQDIDEEKAEMGQQPKDRFAERERD